MNGQSDIRCKPGGLIFLWLLSAALVALYLMPSRLLIKVLWYLNHNLFGSMGVKLTMIGVSSIGHVVLFAVMAIALLRFTRLRLLCVVLVLGAGAALIELAQRWVPSRSCSLKDLALNFAGIALGAVLSIVLFRIRCGNCDRITVEEKERF
jgi:glycopeptide antibiotics resistance protein